MSQPNMHT